MALRAGLSTIEPISSFCFKPNGPLVSNVSLYVLSHQATCKVPYNASRRYLKNLSHTCSVPERCKTNLCDSNCVLNRDYKDECCKSVELMEMQHICNQDILLYFQSLKSILRIWMKYDAEFRPKAFLSGSQQAVVQVSRLISECNFEALEGLVTVKAMRELKANVKNMSNEQRRMVAVEPQQIVHKFIYDVRLIESPLLNQSWAQEITEIIPATKAEILVVFEGSLTGPKRLWQSSDLKDKFVCNYKFEKSFDNWQSGWIITQLNHFVPKTQH